MAEAPLIIICAVSVPYMAWLSRMSGGAKPSLPFGLDQWLLCLPFIPLMIFVHAPVWLIALAYLSSVAGARTGHGQYMDLGRWNKPVKPEKLDFIVTILTGRKDNFKDWKRDAVGDAVTGAAVTIGPSIVIAATGNFWAAGALFMAGVMKAAAYMIGWAVFPERKLNWPEDMDEATELAELLRGGFLGAGMTAACFLVV